MDWLKDHVHDTVREIRRRSAVIPEKEDVSILLNDNLYERDIVIATRIIKSSPHPERRLQAIKDIGHWAWSGGPPVAKFASNYLSNLLGIATDHNKPPSMVKAAVQAIGNICCSSKEASQITSALEISESLCGLLDHYSGPKHEDLRHNVAATLLIVCSENNENQKITLKYPLLKEKLRKMAKEDWCNWPNNEAQRLYTFLGYDRQNEKRAEN